MKALVTGGAGFIGSHLVEHLLAQGDEVRVLDDLSTGQREQLPLLAIDFIEGDVADWETVRRAVLGCDLVFHQAALVSVPRSIDDPASNHRTNVEGTFNVLEAARQVGIRRVVYASSAAVYGRTAPLPQSEATPPTPSTPYGVAKQMGEQYAQLYNQLYGMCCIGLRYFNVYGPRQVATSPYSGVLSIFLERLSRQQPLPIYGDGRQTRDFIYVGDVVRANLAAARYTPQRPTDPVVFNVGTGRETTLLALADQLQTISETAVARIHDDPRPGDLRRSVADTALARRHLGFTAEVALAQGLRETFNASKELSV